jgi:hypothetical protein
MNPRSWPKLWVRLPPDVKGWLESEAVRNVGSQNGEIVRALRERMDRASSAVDRHTLAPQKV